MDPTHPIDPAHRLEHTGIAAGGCAWDADFYITQPAGTLADGLVVVRYSTDLDRYRRLAVSIPARLPLALCIDEPQFTRRFTPMVQERLAALGRARVDLLILNVHEPSDLKAGGIPRQMQAFREQSVISHVGLFHQNINQAEWMAIHTNARVICFPWSLDHQLARYRAVDKAAEYGMDRLGLATPLADEPWPVETDHDVAFRLADRARVLPVLGRVTAGVVPLDGPALDEAWARYRAAVPEPEKLPRSLPPD